jgi:superfamily II DNA or RNA helicase
MQLRPYQQNIVDRIGESDANRMLVEAMTGLGKTVIFSRLAHDWDGRVLVLVHREELADQAERTIRSLVGEDVGIEMAGRTVLGSLLGRPRVIVASVQSLVASGGRRLEQIAESPPSLIIVDECHHATARTWRRVIDRFPAARVVGFTATADRSDKAGLAGVFETVIARYGAYDAINDGWLVPLRAVSVRVEGLDYSSVRTTAGELNGADLERVLCEERVPQGFAAGLHEFADDGHRILAFCPSVACADRVAEILNRRTEGIAEFVSGGTLPAERERIISAFRAGRCRILLNCAVLTEGFDDAGIDAVAILGATKSRSRYVQMVGRGLRPLPGTVDGHSDAIGRREAIAASDKSSMLVIDFAGVAGRHSLIGPLDVLGVPTEPAIHEAAKRVIEESGDGTDVMEAIEEARRRAAARRAKIVATAHIRRSEPIDPRMIEGVSIPPPSRWDEAATERQIAFLDRAGISTKGVTKRAAGKLITHIIERRNQGLSTEKQIRFLRRMGIDARELTMQQASRLIDEAIGKTVPA